MATLVSALGPIRTVTPTNGRTFNLAELQGMVGGYIEALRTPDGVGWLFLNEDGKRLELPYNHAATTLMRALIRPDDVIVGDCVICSPLEAGEGVDDDEPDEPDEAPDDEPDA